MAQAEFDATSVQLACETWIDALDQRDDPHSMDPGMAAIVATVSVEDTLRQFTKLRDFAAASVTYGNGKVTLTQLEYESIATYL